MSKEVIYLEPDEEITSIIDKLKSLEHAKHVILVSPKNAAINQSVVNLKILKKEAENLEIEIALVTGDLVGRNLASQVGIPIYETINSVHPLIEPAKEEPNLNDVIEIDMTERQAAKPPSGVKVNYYNPETQTFSQTKPHPQKDYKPSPVTHSMASPISTEHYHEPAFSRPKTSKKWIWKLVIILIILAVGFTAFYLYYPKANINLVIKSDPVKEKIEITIDNSTRKVSDDGKTIPGETLSSHKEVTKDFNATGKKDVGEIAKGTATIANGAGTVTNLPAGSQLETSSGLIFKTTQDVNVPAATASVDAAGNVIKNPGKTDVQVEAAEAGDKYNQSNVTFSVDNFSNLSATGNTSGGISKQITVVAASDLENAQKALEEEAKNNIKSDLANVASGKKLSVIVDSIQYKDDNFFADQKVNAEVEKFNATDKLTGEVIAFTESDYRDAVIKALGSKIPPDKELVLSTNDQIEQGNFSADFSKGTMRIEGTIKTKLAPKIDYNALKNSLKGQNLIVAENLLRQNSAIASSEIKLNVGWIKKLPSKTSNIIINKSYSN